MDLAQIPVISKDNTDRNRTSPFAFTGNKFEFRALGSGQSISVPIAYLNAAVSQALTEMNAALSKKAGSSTPSEAQIFEVINATYADVKAVCFEGDGYSEEWHQEAEKRGLANNKTTPEALEALKEEKNINMLIGTGIFSSSEELESRFNVLIEKYNMLKLIELETLQEMVSSQIIPAANQSLQETAKTLRYIDKVLDTVPNTQRKNLEKLCNLQDQLISGRDKLGTFIQKLSSITDHRELGMTLANEGSQMMAELRAVCNDVELFVDDTLWPLPKYQEMIYSI